MFCGNCGNQIDDRARFCPYCGWNVLTSGGRNNSGSGMPERGYGAPNQNDLRRDPNGHAPNRGNYGPDPNGYVPNRGNYGPEQDLKNEKKKTGALKGAVIALAALLLIGGGLLIALFLIRKDDNDYRHYIDLGNKYLADMNYDEAVSAFTMAIDIEPKAVDAYMGRADAYTYMEEYDLARADYEQAMEIDPDRREEIQIRIDDLPASGGGRDLSAGTIGDDKSPGEPQEQSSNVPVLRLEMIHEEDTGVNCSASYCRASLGDGTDTLFPELNSSITAFSDELTASVREEYLNYLSFAAQSEYPLYTDLSIDLARSDENLVSMIIGTDNYSGGAHGYYSNGGATFDTKSGRRLTLEDVCTDTSALADIVSNMLYAENAERFSSDSSPADLANTLREGYINPSDDSCWVIEPEGILFYFPPYSISFFAAGQPFMLVRFTDYPDLFNGQYCTVQEEYVSYIPAKGESAMKVDFDEDGSNDELTVYAVYEEGTTSYDIHTGFGISLNHTEVLRESTEDFTEMRYYTASVGGREMVLVEILRTDGQHTTYVYDMTGGSPVKTEVEENGIFRSPQNGDGEDSSCLESAVPGRLCFGTEVRKLTENGVIE